VWGSVNKILASYIAVAVLIYSGYFVAVSISIADIRGDRDPITSSTPSSFLFGYIAVAISISIPIAIDSGSRSFVN
jgi:hypothetical protein